MRAIQLGNRGLPPLPEEIPAELAERIRRAAAPARIAIASIQGTFNMSHPDAEFRRAGLRRLRVIASACRQLGTSVIAICIGTRDRENMWRYHADNHSPQAWRDMIACVGEAVDIARHSGVTLAFEPEVTNVVDSASGPAGCSTRSAAPQLKVTMDAANLFHAGELPHGRGAGPGLCRGGTRHHPGPCQGSQSGRRAGHEAAGHGRLDYDRYLRFAADYGFSGPLLLHGLAESQVAGCVAFLREKLARAALAEKSV